MKKSLWLALGVSLSLMSPLALSHGGQKPEHGGMVKVEHELAFELVREAQHVSLYVKDHGKPYATEKLRGSVLVLASSNKSEAKLEPAGDNKMTAAITIPDGAKVLLRVKEGDHHPITIRFSY